MKRKLKFYTIKRFSDLQRALAAPFLLLFHPSTHSVSPTLRTPPSTPVAIPVGHRSVLSAQNTGVPISPGFYLQKGLFMAFHWSKPQLFPTTPASLQNQYHLGESFTLQSLSAKGTTFSCSGPQLQFCVLRVRRHFPDNSSIMLLSS